MSKDILAAASVLKRLKFIIGADDKSNAAHRSILKIFLSVFIKSTQNYPF